MTEKNLLQESKEIFMSNIEMSNQCMKADFCTEDKQKKTKTDNKVNYLDAETQTRFNNSFLKGSHQGQVHRSINEGNYNHFSPYEQSQHQHDVQNTYAYSREHLTDANNFDDKQAICDNVSIPENEMTHANIREDVNRSNDYSNLNNQFYNVESYHEAYRHFIPYGYYSQQMNADNNDLMNQNIYHFDHCVYPMPPPPFFPYYYQGFPNKPVDYRKFKKSAISHEDKQFYDPLLFVTDDHEMEKKYMKPEKIPNSAKPSFSYSQLITQALETSENGILTLNQIYGWIKNNFDYYQNADTTWQNSIRHNLSLNKMFKKVARPANNPGKGGFWTIDYDFIAKDSPRTKARKTSFFANTARRRSDKRDTCVQREYDSNESSIIEVNEIDFYKDLKGKNNKL